MAERPGAADYQTSAQLGTRISCHAALATKSHRKSGEGLGN